MSQVLLTPDIIASEALIQLENSMVMGNLVYRDLETYYEEQKIGTTIRIRRPVQFTIRTGAVAQVQDIQEGNTSMVVNTQKGVDFQFNSADLTLDIDRFSERYIKPAMIQIANAVDVSLMTEAYRNTNNCAGTSGQTINSFSDFMAGPVRLDDLAVPVDGRSAVLSPTDQGAMVGSFGNGANFFQPDLAKTAIQRAKLPTLANVDTYMSQNVIRHTFGGAGSPLVLGSNQAVAYSSVLTTMTQTLNATAFTASTAINAGDVFTIAGVYAVNPVSKATQSYLQQFTVVTSTTSNATATNTATTPLTIYPAIITSGPYQTVSATNADLATMVFFGTAAAVQSQNLVFHKNAYALAVVPLELPVGAAYKGRQTKNGLSVRVVGDYDFTNDLNAWRFDVLYGVKAIDPRLATRLSGTA